ncbi:MAG: 3-hydroxyacyl-CoA dehydrogenase NAD-binding domain-containing protein [Bryobacteraceae bacterium]
MQTFRRVAVLGAGTMGSRIAALFANAGIPSLLLDIPSTDGDRDRVAKRSLENALKQKPSAFFTDAGAALVEVGNFDDDLSRINECQWVVEAVTEDLDIKRALWSRVERPCRPDAILSTNTSGIRLAEISRDFPSAFKRQFLGTHFFNPPRYLHLLEVIPGAETDSDVIQFVSAFGERTLGKGIVICKDTPNFIANRIGSFYSAAVQRAMVEGDYTIEEADALTGPLIGMPKSASFRLIDVIGLDVWTQVARNVYTAVHDSWSDWLRPAPYVQKMLENGWLGEKAGQGFYKRVGPEKQIHVLDWKTFEYHPAPKVLFESVEVVRKIPDLGSRVRALFDKSDRASAFVWQVLANVFAYSAAMIPEIADRIIEIDRAMRWGFGHKLGPFELWDAIGFEYVVNRMQSEHYELPKNIRRMLSAGASSFYRPAEYFDLVKAAYASLESRPGVLILADVKRARGEVDKNTDASLIDVGDGVLCLEFHSKMNAIGEETLVTVMRGIELLKRDFEAMIIANEGENFSVGANLQLLLMAAESGDFDTIEMYIRHFQQATLHIKYASKAIVCAGFSRALGGGCEVVLQSRRVQALAELNIGFVELNVGLIPAAGGTKEMALRFADPMKGLDLIAQAKVSNSAVEAKQLGFLQPADRISMNPELLVGDAKQFALELSESYQSGELQKDVVVSGEPGYERMRQAVEAKKKSGEITEHDFVILEKAAYVLSGGRVAAAKTVSEQQLLDLEREAFLSLCAMPKSQERIRYMLKNGKPLRN